jgi:thiamine pyrophosphokinase
VQEQAPFPILTFEGPLVIIGGGTVDAALLRELHAAGARLVAADSGADQIVAAGLLPEAIIGDLDSLSHPEDWPGRARLLHIAEQDTTDFEKALYSTRAPVTVALGMTGKRLDHTLAAIDALARYAAGRAIILVDETDAALGVAGRVEFDVQLGDRVSVHPLRPIRFRHSSGLRYPLDGLRLAPGERTGTSNAASAETVVIEPEPGQPPFLLILPLGYLFRMIERLTGGRPA